MFWKGLPFTRHLREFYEGKRDGVWQRASSGTCGEALPLLLDASYCH